MLLDGVVGKMNEGVVESACGILLTGCSNVTLSEEEEFKVGSQKSPHPDVEFSVVDQHWPFDVFLNHEGTGVQLVCLPTKKHLTLLSFLFLPPSLLLHALLGQFDFLAAFITVVSSGGDFLSKSTIALLQFPRVGLTTLAFSVHGLKMFQHFLLQLLQRIEYLYAPPSIETSRLQQPKVVV